jgi:hypothetical protein
VTRYVKKRSGQLALDTAQPRSLATPADPPRLVDEPWTTQDEVVAAGGDPLVDYAAAIMLASEMLYELSGHRFPGYATRTERPGAAIPDIGYPRLAWSHDRWIGTGVGLWCTEAVERIVLNHVVARDAGGLPIADVKIDGSVVDPATWRVEDWHYLVRLAPYRWPARQLLNHPDTDPGTFSVTYTGGRRPPAAGVEAAIALTLEVVKAQTGGKCTLPLGVTQIVRAGITLTRAALVEVRKGGWGVPAVDMFLAAYPGDTATVWTPDLPQTSPRV